MLDPVAFDEGVSGSQPLGKRPMDEYEEHYWNRDTHPRPERDGWTFSLASLLRVITVAGMALGWCLLLPAVQPNALQLVVVWCFRLQHSRKALFLAFHLEVAPRAEQCLSL